MSRTGGGAFARRRQRQAGTVSLDKQPEGQARGWGRKRGWQEAPQVPEREPSLKTSGMALGSWALAVLVKGTLGCWPPSHIQ